MAEDGSPGQSDPPEMSGTFVLQKRLDELSRPLFHRLGELLGFAERALVLQAAARERHASPEAGYDWIRREVCRRVLSPWASGLDLAEDDARRGLVQVGAQLDALPDQKPKRVYYALCALERAAARPSVAFQAAGQALAMTRNTVDRNKARALEHARAGTCFASLAGFRLGELHLFCLDLDGSLLIAARRLLQALDTQPGEAAVQLDEAHAEANRQRRRYDEKRLDAQQAWKTRLAAALDASGMRPLDAERRFAARARAAGQPAEEIASRTRQAWQNLRLSDAVPDRVLPTTTWTAVLGRAPRPPTFILEGPWTSLVGGLGLAEEALGELVRAAHQTDEALRTWNDAAERTYQTTRGRPRAVVEALENFNLSLEGALGSSAKGVAQ